MGTFGDKAAIVAIDGGEPRTIRVGQRVGPVALVSVRGDQAVVEVDGRPRTLVRGQTYSTRAGSDRQTATLTAGSGGHFIAEGQVNGGAVRFLVDTGATMIALPASDARRLGIDYASARRASARTASGTTPVFLVKLDTVRVGTIELHNVEAAVIEQGLDTALLGMSFLNRVEMQRDGERMLLTRRF